MFEQRSGLESKPIPKKHGGRASVQGVFSANSRFHHNAMTADNTIHHLCRRLRSKIWQAYYLCNSSAQAEVYWFYTRRQQEPVYPCYTTTKMTEHYSVPCEYMVFPQQMTRCSILKIPKAIPPLISRQYRAACVRVHSIADARLVTPTSSPIRDQMILVPNQDPIRSRIEFRTTMVQPGMRGTNTPYGRPPRQAGARPTDVQDEGHHHLRDRGRLVAFERRCGFESRGRRNEVCTEQRRNVRAGEAGNPRENTPTSGIVRHDCHMRKFGDDPAGNRTRLGGRRVSLNTSTPCYFTVLLDRRMNKVMRHMAMLVLHTVEEYTSCIQVDLKQGFQKCSFYSEQPIQIRPTMTLANVPTSLPRREADIRKPAPINQDYYRISALDISNNCVDEMFCREKYKKFTEDRRAKERNVLVKVVARTMGVEDSIGQCFGMGPPHAETNQAAIHTGHVCLPFIRDVINLARRGCKAFKSRWSQATGHVSYGAWHNGPGKGKVKLSGLYNFKKLKFMRKLAEPTCNCLNNPDFAIVLCNGGFVRGKSNVKSFLLCKKLINPVQVGLGGARARQAGYLPAVAALQLARRQADPQTQFPSAGPPARAAIPVAFWAGRHNNGLQVISIYYAKRACSCRGVCVHVSVEGQDPISRPVRGKLEILVKTRRPTASSGKIPTSQNPGVTRPGIEPGEQSNRSATTTP
ncbi:hypothetical protein PR048_030028 [Dryococelus australis]|uniref:Uncharacterized protein n=1 Tax=Dryococelus australis TaxID=614101 RepID=A0ABQ9G7T7_9NEOP|nr:hypothetical protein PR048_030028 [Dryococelus australis]